MRQDLRQLQGCDVATGCDVLASSFLAEVGGRDPVGLWPEGRTLACGVGPCP